MARWRAFIAACLATGVVSAVASAASPITLDVWDWSKWRADLIQEMADQYTAANPGVTIHVQTVGNYWNKLSVAVAGGTAPDIVYFHNGHATELLSALEPLPETLFPVSEMNDLYFRYSDDFLIRGKAYFLPTGIMAPVIFYNKDLWADAGLTGTPTTWDQLRVDAKKAARSSGGGVLTTGGFELEPGSVVDLWRDLNYQYGGWIFSADHHKVDWDTEAGRKAINQISDLIFSDGSVPIPSRDGGLGFLSGKSVMHYHWAYWRANVAAKGINFGVFPLPTVDGAEAVGANNYEAGLAVIKGTPAAREAEAFRFLQWLAHNEEFQIRLNVDGGRIPGLKSLWQDSRVQGDAVMQALMQEVPSTVFVGEFPAKVRAALNQMGLDLFKQTASPQALLAKAQQQGDVIVGENPPTYVVERG